MTGQASIGEWIRRAYSDEEGCPPPEAYLAEELATLDAGARERLESHAESCVACAAERELARAFEASETTGSRENREIDAIARRLERRPPHGRRASWLASWATIARAPAFQLAAALVLLIGVGLGIRNAATPPPLSGGPGESATRSSTLELVAPVGELAELPAELVWQGVEGASEYRITIKGVDDSELWSAATPLTSIVVDENLIAQLRSAVWYVWTVEALDGTGRRIAWSREARFRVSPVGSQSR